MKSDFRARNHPAYWAFLVHRVSGVMLSLFLPLHFWVLAQALQGEARLDSFLRCVESESEPEVTGLDGRRALELAERITAAIRAQSW